MKIIRTILVIIGIGALIFAAGSPGAVDAGHISMGRCFAQMLGGVIVFAVTLKVVKAI